MRHLIILLVSSLLIASCSWVEITEEGKAIRVTTLDKVAKCKRVGKVFAQLKDQIAGFDRNEEKVKGELETLARNTAASDGLGGDTIVPISPIEKGKQTFAVYKCIPD